MAPVVFRGTLQIPNGWGFSHPATGELVSLELFVGVLPSSSLTYAEFCYTQRMKDFIGCHQNMFKKIGGSPKVIVPDNCKTPITRHGQYDVHVNATYQDFCKHYGVVVDPARVRAPQDKPYVERAIGILQRDFLPRLRNLTITSLAQAKKWLQGKL